LRDAVKENITAVERRRVLPGKRGSSNRGREQVIGGAEVELDAKRAIDQETRVAALQGAAPDVAICQSGDRRTDCALRARRSRMLA